MPFTPCLDVTVRVAAVPRTAFVAACLQEEIDARAADGRRWALRSFTAEAEGGELVVRARLLEPLADFYGADPDAPGELRATDVVIALLRRNCPSWRGLDALERPLRAETRRVRRRFWTQGETGAGASPLGR